MLIFPAYVRNPLIYHSVYCIPNLAVRVSRTCGLVTVRHPEKKRSFNVTGHAILRKRKPDSAPWDLARSLLYLA